MAGHNKFSKIKHKKAATDAKKSKIFSTHVKNITIALKEAGGDASSPSVRSAIERAQADSMPKQNIERTIERASGKNAQALEQVTYEAYGPGGVALIIEGFTDNKNRASQEVKHALSSFGLSLAAQGAASWAFEKSGNEWVPQTKTPLGDDDKEKLAKVIEKLEEKEDVDTVFSNEE
ncbi:YebC/PmpR family DNA-binding transcriptional regulator [bacterium]|nr:YebC/PmpR family DNA-binding transcriptional regulator [bacterium]|tara:strand:- start:10088 stop:10618 length:531 start_codon:yes stop_codon:yes gene_type:complete